MPLDWIVILVILALLSAGIIAQLVRVRRAGLRGREAFRAIFRPAQIIMQASATASGLPAPRLEPADPINDGFLGATGSGVPKP